MEQEAEFIRKSIRSLHRDIEKSIQKQTEQAGITLPQMRVIREVVSHQSSSIKQLSQSLHMTQSTVSGIVDRLITKGILLKTVDPNDRRAVKITPTENVNLFMQNDRSKFVNQVVMDALSRLKADELSIAMNGIRLLLSVFQDTFETDEKEDFHSVAIRSE